jgi:serine/threonine protein kinase
MLRCAVPQRIKAVEYSFPDDRSNRALTPECKDLIRRMLVHEPAKRATLREIMEHRWYQVRPARARSARLHRACHAASSFADYLARRWRHDVCCRC